MFTIHSQILELLSLTMASPQLLVQGGIFYKRENKPESDLRNAQRAMKKLYVDGYVDYKKYPVAETENYHRFYYLKSKVFEEMEGKSGNYHRITERLVIHESLITLFLIHIFRGYGSKYSFKWHSPYEISTGDKRCDGGISLMRNGKRRRFLLLEADTGRHSHHKIQGKLPQYLECTMQQPDCLVYFLISGSQRKKNLSLTIQTFLQRTGREIYRKKFRCVCPKDLPPDYSFAKRDSASGG